MGNLVLFEKGGQCTLHVYRRSWTAWISGAFLRGPTYYDEYLGTVYYDCGDDWAEYAAYLAAQRMLAGAALVDVAEAAQAAANGSELVIRTLNGPLDAIIDGVEFVYDPSLGGLIAVVVPGALGNAGKQAGKACDAGSVLERKGIRHHIGTNKNWVSDARGGPWSPQFEKVFHKAGMSLEDEENVVRLVIHKGPHPEAYHQTVWDRLTAATRGLEGDAYRDALKGASEKMAKELKDPCSHLSKLLRGD
jgi:hypothetical protein